MTNKPLISIVIPCFKMGAYIGEALESVGKQSYTHWEVLAVDDCGPEDGTQAIVESFAASHPDHRVEFTRLEQNGGVSVARNAGIKAAKAEVLAFLDPDDIWTQDHLERHMLAREGKDEPLMVTASKVGIFQDGNGLQVDMLWGYSAWEQQVFPLSLAMRNAMNPSALLVPKALVESVGGYDEDRALQHTEDWDLWLRLVEAGAEFVFVNEMTGYYRQHAGAGTADRLLIQKRLGAFAEKNIGRILPKLSLATFRMSNRVEGIEARLDWIQKNPVMRMLSFFQRLIGKKQ
jgi:glycosyltransferase involved in cell wall biosynthesis